MANSLQFSGQLGAGGLYEKRDQGHEQDQEQEE